MDSKQIEQLLQRYWNCETTLEEEKALRQFFTTADVPQHLMCYKDMFLYQEFLQDDHLDEEFDEQLLKLIEQPVVQAQHVSIFSRLAPIAKVAAAVTVLLALGNVAERTLLQDYHQIAVNDTIGQQIISPSVALGDDGEVDAQAKDSLTLQLKTVEQQECIKK
ncbi:MAG: hypothetical protein K5856_04740 [Bacteroidaceae bacterium]|nr:hypothetical protein [Bacteroidaceae bacterium]